jgi:hypothetical protein
VDAGSPTKNMRHSTSGRRDSPCPTEATVPPGWRHNIWTGGKYLSAQIQQLVEAAGHRPHYSRI